MCVTNPDSSNDLRALWLRRAASDTVIIIIIIAIGAQWMRNIVVVMTKKKLRNGAEATSWKMIVKKSSKQIEKREACEAIIRNVEKCVLMWMEASGNEQALAPAQHRFSSLKCP